MWPHRITYRMTDCTYQLRQNPDVKSVSISLLGHRSWRIFPRFSAFGTVQKLSGQNHTAFFFREINPFCRHARFDRCRSQDQWSVLSWCASVVTVAAACHTSGLWRILHLSAREFPGAQDAPDSQPIGFLERHSADCSHFSRFVAAKQHRRRYTWLQYLRAKLPRNFPKTKVSDLFRTCLDGALRNRTRHVRWRVSGKSCDKSETSLRHLRLVYRDSFWKLRTSRRNPCNGIWPYCNGESVRQNRKMQSMDGVRQRLIDEWAGM